MWLGPAGAIESQENHRQSACFRLGGEVVVLTTIFGGIAGYFLAVFLIWAQKVSANEGRAREFYDYWVRAMVSAGDAGAAQRHKTGRPALLNLSAGEATGLRLSPDLDSGCPWGFTLAPQPRNNGVKFIEHLIPALELTAIFCALHGFISDEGEFRPAVS